MFNTPIQKFQYYDKYSRFDYDMGRREKWDESVDRVVEFLRALSNNALDEKDYQDIREAILGGDVMPSMRLLAMAGEAAARNHVSVYNCAYLGVESIQDMVDILTISMAGTGVGYSVEKQYVRKLPPVRVGSNGNKFTHVVQDSSEGWADAFRVALESFWSGNTQAEFDYSLVRPAGAPLRTKGGRASGPEPLKDLIEFSRGVVSGAAGRKLTTLEAHDIVTKVGACVVSGGVRRTAMIALFDADDQLMLTCKSPGNIEGNYQRFNANNSAVWTRRMSRSEIAKQMYAMAKDGTGEPGIFSRVGAQDSRPERRSIADFGTNPCGEIILRPRQFCNLSQAIARANDDLYSLVEKVRLATIIGTIQSMATNAGFEKLHPDWKKNGEEERLLGVDINGQMDCRYLLDNAEEAFPVLRLVVQRTNEQFADLLGINRSAATTCVKPSGNSSVLLDCAPGVHPRHSRYYIRRVRVNSATPMAQLLFESGMDLKPEVGQTWDNATTFVAEFKVKSPEGAVVKGQRNAIEQLEWWKTNKLHWTEHNPSVTITYNANELEGIIDWIFHNQSVVNGLSFLPNSDVYYELMPYEEVTEQEYNDLTIPEVDFDRLADIDNGVDNTTAAQELACFAGGCEI